MLYKIKNKRIKTILKVILYITLIMPYTLGGLTYYLSKILRALSYILMFKLNSFKEELREFLSINTSIKDGF